MPNAYQTNATKWKEMQKHANNMKNIELDDLKMWEIKDRDMHVGSASTAVANSYVKHVGNIFG